MTRNTTFALLIVSLIALIFSPTIAKADSPPGDVPVLVCKIDIKLNANTTGPRLLPFDNPLTVGAIAAIIERPPLPADSPVLVKTPDRYGDGWHLRWTDSGNATPSTSLTMRATNSDTKGGAVAFLY